jgi:hypothetical protein
MATRNFEAERRRQEESEAYVKLRAWIAQKDNSEYWPAQAYLTGLETKIDEQAKQIEEYRKFFATLDSFLPRRFSIHDVIG